MEAEGDLKKSESDKSDETNGGGPEGKSDDSGKSGAASDHSGSDAASTSEEKSAGAPADQAATSLPPEALQDKTGDRPADKRSQTHMSRFLDEVLEDTSQSPKQKRLAHPIVLDVLIGCGLLLAMGGFSVGLFKIYVAHSAQQSINQHDYRAAIALLRGSPLPGWFSFTGAAPDADELLNRALYLDSMERLEINNDDNEAISQLSKIQPGSHYFLLAQDTLRAHYKPSSRQLSGEASHDASPTDVDAEPKPIIPDEPKEGSQ